MRLLRARPSLVDGVLAVGLGVLAQVMVWSGRVAGPRVAVAALFLLVGFPLIVRRRLPLVPVVLLMTAIAVQSVATSDAAEGAPLLLLTSTGARSGERRTTPVVYQRDGERLVIFASKAGAPTNLDVTMKPKG